MTTADAPTFAPSATWIEDATAAAWDWIVASIGSDPRPVARSLSENEIAARVAKHPDDFVLLYDEYYERILNFLYRRAGNRETAEELTSQTFLQAFEHLSAAERLVRFRPWIYRVAVNVHASHARRSKRWFERIPLLGLEHSRRTTPAPGAALAREQQGSELRRAVESLPAKYRDALVLRYDEELAYDDVAAVLGLTAEGARTRVMRGIQLLRERIRPR